MENNHSSPFDRIIEFFNVILLFNKLYSLESHKKADIRILAIKRKEIFEIFYIRIEFISEIEDMDSHEISKNEKIIAIREIFENQNLIETIENDEIGGFL